MELSDSGWSCQGMLQHRCAEEQSRKLSKELGQGAKRITSLFQDIMRAPSTLLALFQYAFGHQVLNISEYLRMSVLLFSA